MKILKIVFNVLAWVLLIFALLITMVVFSSNKNNDVANLFGYIPLTVESDSMLPKFKTGDLIICKEVDDVYDLKEGDVITFWTIINGNKVKNTHRIVEIVDTDNSRSFITRGDNNDANDETNVRAGDVIAKWTNIKVSGFGKVMDFLGTRKGFFICIIIPMALFFLFELYKFIATLVEIKKPAISEEDEEEIKRRAIEEYLASQKEKEKEGSGKDSKESGDDKDDEPEPAPAEAQEPEKDTSDEKEE
ncbi:MAG: signal peptidase I [Ruminococcus sp.]|nr:signal peptidase I [Ruminococcus sp.]